MSDSAGPRMVKDAARRRAKRNRQDRKTIDAYKRTVREIEELAHRSGEVVATGQTIAKAVLRRSMSPIERLKKHKKLSGNEEAAATDLLFAYAIESGDPPVRKDDLGTKIDNDSNTEEVVAARRIDTFDKFREWRADLKHTNAYRVVTAVLFQEQPIADVARENCWGYGTTLKHFYAGLRHFAALRGNVPRGLKWRLPVGGK